MRVRGSHLRSNKVVPVSSAMSGVSGILSLTDTRMQVGVVGPPVALGLTIFITGPSYSFTTTGPGTGFGMVALILVHAIVTLVMPEVFKVFTQAIPIWFNTVIR
jgi:hypothetical protein